jgi:nitroreductase
MPETQDVHPLIATRWSPRAFEERRIEPSVLRSLFEAARWSASCFNEQPWRFVVATKDRPEEFQRLLDVLVPQNQQWAKSAWVLVIAAAKKTFTHNGKHNHYPMHDAGAALALLAIQANAVGLHVHAMGGFDHARARADFAIPDDFEVASAFVIGYVDGAPEPPAGRTRRALDETVFGVDWGKPADFVA